MTAWNLYRRNLIRSNYSKSIFLFEVEFYDQVKQIFSYYLEEFYFIKVIFFGSVEAAPFSGSLSL